MNKIYVVALSAGSYSDYSHTNICAFLDIAQAETFAQEKNEQVERYRKARSELYEHMRAWDADNPQERLSEHDRKRANDIERVSKNDRTRKQLADLAEIDAKAREMNVRNMKRWEQYKAEQVNFINGRDYLTDKDKSALNEDRFHTDGSYDVEEIELRG